MAGMRPSNPRRILFLNLKMFSASGGIERFNRVFVKSLDDISQKGNFVLKVFSLYDEHCDERYIKNKDFRGFKGSKLKFVLSSLKEGAKADLLFVGHVNLSLIGNMVKGINARLKTVLLTYGIDIWDTLSYPKRKGLYDADIILTISNYTMARLLGDRKILQDKIMLLHPSLDCFFNKNYTCKSDYLAKRLGIGNGTRVMLTISRLDKLERYKGHEKVIQALPYILKKVPYLKYLIVGGGNDAERLKTLVKWLNLEQYVIFTGFIPDNELIDYYYLCDLFVMPSKGEGFGIVFIEALACGRPVIAGDRDGSRDAILDGKLGVLVDPDDVNKLAEAIINVLEGKVAPRLLDPGYLRETVLEHFGYDKFSKRVEEILQRFSPSS